MATASFLLTLAVPQRSDAVAPMARAEADQFAGDDPAPFVQLAMDLGFKVARYSLLARKGARPTAAAGTVPEMIRTRL